MSETQEVEYEVVGRQEESAEEPTGKKRGRKSREELLARSGDDPAVIEAEIAEENRIKVVDSKFGDGQPYERDRLEIEVRCCLKQSASSYLEAGYRLVQLKEHEPHGNFLESLKNIGIGVDVAQKMMLTARKLQGTKLANADADRHLLPSKLYEIALLDDDQLDELEKEGSTGSITLDDIQRMSTREVRQALREERRKRQEETDARERVIKEKNDKLDELERELRGTPAPTPREVSQRRLFEIKKVFLAKCVDLDQEMQDMARLMDEAQRLPGLTVIDFNGFESELVESGTELVANSWEALCEAASDLQPVKGEDDVPGVD